MRSLLSGGAEWIHRSFGWLRSCLWFVGSIVLGLLIKENFPFSHWPMYSNFARQTDYVYVVDANSKPVAAAAFFESAPRLRKQFQRELKGAAQSGARRSEASTENEAAVRVLERLARRMSPEQRLATSKLGLVRAEVRIDGRRKIVVSERTVAIIELTELGPAAQDPARSKKSL